MKADDLLEAMTEIDDRYLAEAEEFSGKNTEIHKRKIIRMAFPKIKTVAIAACLCVVVTGVIVINNGTFRMGNMSSENRVTGSQIAQQSDTKYAMSIMEENSGKPETVMSSKNNSEEYESSNELDTTNDFSSAQLPMEPLKMVRIKGILYVDTDRYDDVGRCGVMDGTIVATTASPGAIPQKENESNFGENIEFQYGKNEYQVEILIDDHWHIFQQAEFDSEKNITFIGVEEGEEDDE